jgi:ABC-type cobalamin/Fe3+-siderophores transport system ATPase subunit
VPESLLLIGPNGSGKTTLLNVIAGLWELFKRWIEASVDRDPKSANRMFIHKDSGAWPHLDLPTNISSDFELAAMEIVGLEDQPLWIFYEPLDPDHKKERAWIVDQQETFRVGITLGEESVPLLTDTFLSEYYPPGSIKPLLDNDSSNYWLLVDKWRERLTENILGKRADLPNMVFIESDDRRLLKINESFQVIREPEEFHWLARYEPTSRRQGSLENYLFNLSAVNQSVFDQIVEQVNAFLVDKRIVGFDSSGRALMVEVAGQGRHPVEQLSSGEKQVLLMIAFITRWLRPGGIVLIDEPDLHLHISWTNAFVNHLRRMVAEQNGQLIIASHEPSLWKHFTQSHQMRLGRLETMQR